MSDGYIIIDRRENPKAKSLSNRQRFINRSRAAIRQSAKKAMGERAIRDNGDTSVAIPTDGVEEPQFRHDRSVGEYDYVLPGNTQYVVGDRIPKNEDEDDGNGSGVGGNGEGGEDDFEFILSYEEYVNIIFDDLELPDLVKKTEKNAVAFENSRAGYTNVGIPTNLNVEKTAIAGMARRMALRTPKFKKIHELEAELAEIENRIAVRIARANSTNIKVEDLTEADITAIENTQYGVAPATLESRRDEIVEEIAVLRRRASAVSYLDDVDMRYNNFVKRPKPITQAVMFCMMDVSFSMGEREKIIAKKFFILLHLFLQRRYKNIDVVFVRHHTEATECDEDTFFRSREGGGTMVSVGYDKINEIIAARYHTADWNIYLAQASDGDNWDSDNERVTEILSKSLLPAIQHLTYLEIQNPGRFSYSEFLTSPMSNLMETINNLTATFDNISCARIANERDVINVFRKLFKKESADD